jgi:hypothetical protein
VVRRRSSGACLECRRRAKSRVCPGLGMHHRLEPLRCQPHESGTLADGDPRFRSTFAPPDDKPRGTGRNGRGRRGTNEAPDGPFAHVTANDQGQAGTEREPWGAAAATCKSPASAYPGSNPGPATSATTSADMVTIRTRPRNPPGPVSLVRTRCGHDRAWWSARKAASRRQLQGRSGGLRGRGCGGDRKASSKIAGLGLVSSNPTSMHLGLRACRRRGLAGRTWAPSQLSVMIRARCSQLAGA